VAPRAGTVPPGSLTRDWRASVSRAVPVLHTWGMFDKKMQAEALILADEGSGNTGA